MYNLIITRKVDYIIIENNFYHDTKKIIGPSKMSFGLTKHMRSYEDQVKILLNHLGLGLFFSFFFPYCLHLNPSSKTSISVLVLNATTFMPTSTFLAAPLPTSLPPSLHNTKYHTNNLIE